MPQRLHAQPAVRRLSPRVYLRRRGGRGGGGGALVVEDEEGLHQRRVAERSLGVDLLHQLLEGKLLVVVGRQRGVAHAAQQRAERGLAAQVAAQHQRVDEEAHRVFHLGGGAVGDRGAHQHVGLPRPAPQQELEGGQVHHEGRGALGACQRFDARGDGRAQRRVHQPAAGRANGGAGEIGGQLQPRGGAGQRAAPEARQPLEPRARQPLALARGVLAVGQARRGKGRGEPGREGAVERGQLARHHPARPPVAHRVVHRPQQRVVALGHAHQRGAEERRLVQAEGALGVLAGQALELGLALVGRAGGKVDQRERDGRGREHHLHHLVAARLQPGAQGFVPVHELGHRAPERVGVQGPAEAPAAGDVVGVAPRLQPVEQPEAALRERRRVLSRRVGGGGVCRAGGLLLQLQREELPLGGGELRETRVDVAHLCFHVGMGVRQMRTARVV